MTAPRTRRVRALKVGWAPLEPTGAAFCSISESIKVESVKKLE
jgi:hypothetical protein